MKINNDVFVLKIPIRLFLIVLYKKCQLAYFFVKKYLFFAHGELSIYKKIELLTKYLMISIPFILFSNFFSFNFISEQKYRNLIKNTKFYRTIVKSTELEIKLDGYNFLISGWVKPGHKIIVIDRDHVELESQIKYGLSRPDVGRAKGSDFRNSGFIICIPGKYSLKDIHFLIVDQDGNLQGTPHLATDNLGLSLEAKLECVQCKNIFNYENSFIDGISRFFLPTASKNYLNYFIINLCSIRTPFDYELLLLTSKILDLIVLNFFQKIFGQIDALRNNLIFTSFSLQESFNKSLRHQLNSSSNTKFIELSYSNRDGSEKSYELHENFNTYNQIKWTESGVLWPNLTSKLDISLYAGVSNKLIPDYHNSNITGFFLNKSDFRKIRECVLTPSFVIENFFHFFIESLIPLCENTDRSLHSLPLLLPNNIHGNQLDLLKLLGYNNYIFCNSDELISIRECHLVYADNYLVDALESNINSYSINSKQLLNLRDSLLSSIPEAINVSSKNGKLALMRKGGRRSLINNEELESKLVDRGFEIFRPEDSSLQSLVTKIRQSESIFLTGGAAMANLIFAKPGTNVFYLTSKQLEEYSLPKFYANTFGLNFQQLVGNSLSFSNLNNPYDYFHGNYFFDCDILKTL